MKVFEFNANKGSYIDQISGAVGVPSGTGETGFHQTEKGLAWRGNGTSSKVAYDGLVLSGDFSVIGWYKSGYQGSNDNQVIADSGTAFQPFRFRNGLWNYYISDGSNITTQGISSPDINDNSWHFLIFTCDNDGDVTLYLDGEKLFSEVNLSTGDITISELNIGYGASSDYLDGYVGRSALYDHVLTPQERAKLYSEFLSASPTQKAVEDNLDYPALKPHDLSHLVDSRIGVPNANYTDILDSYDFTSGWTAYSAGAVVDSNTFSGAVTQDGIRLNNILTIGKTYIVHLAGTNAGTNFSVGNYAGSTPYYTHITTGAFDFWDVFTASDVGVRLIIDGAANCSITTFELREHGGNELIPDEDVGFVANDVSKWTVYGTNTVEQNGNSVKLTYIDNTGGAYLSIEDGDNIRFNNLSAGDKIKIVLQVKVDSGGDGLIGYNFGGGFVAAGDVLNTDWVTFIIEDTILDPSSTFWVRLGMQIGTIGYMEILSVMKVTGLVAAYNMIPNGETLVDISGGGNNGTIIGAVSKTSSGILMNRSSVEGYVTAPSSPSLQLTNDMTFVMRFKIDDFIKGSPNLISKYNSDIDREFEIRYEDAVNGFRYFDSDNAISTSIQMSSPFKWNNLVFTRTSNTIHFYLNGIEIYSGTVTYSLSGSIGLLRIGGRGNFLLVGEVADAKLYNYAFSEQQSIDYHNQFAKEVKQRDDMSGYGVGSSI